MKRHLALFRLATTPVLLLVASLSSTTAAAQDRRVEDPQGPLTLGLSELVLEQYQVKNVDSGVLAALADSMVGRRYFVREHGNGASPIPSLRQFGRTIVLYDTKDQVARARELLERLDTPAVDGGRDDRKWVSQDYKPRFISLSAAVEAVQDMVDVNVSNERSRIILSGDQASMEEALRLLEHVDVPEQQVLLTCLLLEVKGDASDARLPRELVDNLQSLLPENGFALAGMALLKTTVRAGQDVSVEIESTGKRYRFGLRPAAFDDETATLTANQCELVEMADSGPRTLFSTSTLIRGGEYTVLAGTGATTRLLVVRISRI